jgi:hypothetical protein
MPIDSAPEYWALADEEQSSVLGLPRRTGGWGLLMFEGPDGERTTGAGDRVLVAALDEHEGQIADWT